jgi:hypothetical protein
VVAPTPAPGPAVPTGLTCPTDRISEVGAGYLVVHPVRTDPAAVAAAFRRPGEEVLVERRPEEALAWMVRADGTARAVLTLPRTPGGWTWAGDSSSCADDRPIQSRPTGVTSDQVACRASTGRPAGQVAAGRIARPTTGGAADYEPENLAHRWIQPGWVARDAGDLGDPDRRLVVGTDERGTVRVSLEVARDADLWRVAAVAACPSDVPGLAAERDQDLAALDLGHCWIDTLRHAGREWGLRDEDQFGWGGGEPEGFRAVGVATLTGAVLTYVDASGARLELVPADTPGTEMNQGFCA